MLQKITIPLRKSLYALIWYAFGEKFITNIDKLGGTDLLLKLFNIIDNDGADLIMQLLSNCAEGNNLMRDKLAARASEYIHRFNNADFSLQDSMLCIFSFVSSLPGEVRSKLRLIIQNILYIAEDHHRTIDTRFYANMCLAFLADSNMEKRNKL